MEIDPSKNSVADNYKLLTNLVVPRPIAWVTSRGDHGTLNLAPFSFFNAMGSDPLYLVISVANGPEKGQKDTARNIEQSGEFVVNLITEDVIDAMNVSAADFPPGESELSAAGLHPAESTRVKVARVAEAQASLECTLYAKHPLGAYTMFIGEVVMFHVADHLMGPRLHVNGFAPIGRLGSPSTYCRTTDRFELPRMSYKEWHEKGKPSPGRKA